MALPDSHQSSLPPEDEALARLLGRFQPTPGPRLARRMASAPWMPARQARLRRRWQLAGALTLFLLLFLSTPWVAPSLDAAARKLWTFFTISSTDRMQVEITLPNPNGPPINIQQQDLNLSLEEAEALAGYPLMLPILTGTGLEFQGAWYSDLTHQTALFFLDGDRSLLLIQQPAGVVYHQVGAAAQVESVQIGPVLGEYLLGGWVLHTPAALLASATPGTPVSVEVHWDPSLSRQTLRWEMHGRIFEIIAWGAFSKAELIDLASTVRLP